MELKTGLIINDLYRLESRFSEGLHTDIWTARLLSDENQLFLVKTYKKELKSIIAEEELYLKEKSFWEIQVQLSGLISTREFLVWENWPFWIKNLQSGKNLEIYRDTSSAISENLIAGILFHVGQTLSLLHSSSQNWLHCNIKPSNIIITEEENILLSDPLFSQKNRIHSGWLSQENPNIRKFTSPEWLIGEDIGPKHDIFCLGVTFLEVLYFNQGPDFCIAEERLRGHDLPPLLHYPKRLFDVFSAMTDQNPENRPAATDLAFLAEKYLQRNAWQPVAVPQKQEPVRSDHAEDQQSFDPISAPAPVRVKFETPSVQSTPPEQQKKYKGPSSKTIMQTLLFLAILAVFSIIGYSIYFTISKQKESEEILQRRKSQTDSLKNALK